MPWIIAGIGGLIIGSGATFIIGDTAKKLGTAAVIGAGLYWYIKKAK